MRRLATLVLLMLAALPLGAADASITLTLSDQYVLAYRTYLADRHPDADANNDGNVSGAEALAWIQSRAQTWLKGDAAKASFWAEENAPETLPQAHQDALTARDAAVAALAIEQAKIAP